MCFASDQNSLLDKAIKNASPNTLIEARLHSMCILESSKKIRKYQPQVKQNMDYLGAHNVLLFKQLRKMGFCKDAKDWKQSQEWLLWRSLFQDRPDLGTMIACFRFVELANKHGIDNATMIWKCGKVETVPGLEYLMKAKHLDRCRLRAELN